MWCTVQLWSIKHQHNTLQMQRGHLRLRFWGQLLSSVKQLPVFFYRMVYNAELSALFLFLHFFFQQAESLHLNKKLIFFFFLIWFSHRISDRRGLIVCFQSWLFLPLGLFLNHTLFWDVLTGMILNWKAWCKFYWPPFPTIKDVPHQCVIHRADKGQRGGKPFQMVRSRRPGPDSSCFPGLFLNQQSRKRKQHLGILLIPGWAQPSVNCNTVAKAVSKNWSSLPVAWLP